MKENKTALRNKRIDWIIISSHERQVYTLIGKCRNIDDQMSDRDLLDDIIELLPRWMQTDLAIFDRNEMETFMSYIR